MFPLPDVLSIDNGFGFTAAGRGKRYVSRFIQYLLHLGVTPLFIAPKKPWMNGAVEGTHSVFARKVWNRFDFSNLEEIDETVARFQEAYKKYTKIPDLLPSRNLAPGFSWKELFQKPFHPKEGMQVCLIRLVENHVQGDLEIPAIQIFQEVVELEKMYLNQYVLAVVDIYKGQLNVHVQPSGENLQLIVQKDFPIKIAKRKY